MPVTDPPADGGEKGATIPIVVRETEGEPASLTAIEACQQVWGKTGIRLVILG